MRYYLIFILFTLSFLTSAQESIEGQVSYVNNESVYVRFSSTDGIEVGDTLRMLNDGSACLVVLYKSSISVVTQVIGSCQPQMEDRVLATLHREEQEQVVQADEEATPSDATPTSVEPEQVIADPESIHVRGRASYANYTVLSADGFYTGYTRNVARLNLDIENVSPAKLDIELNGNYQHFTYFDRESTRPSNEGRLNVYNALVRWSTPLSSDGSRQLTVNAGRFSNRNAASIGPVDGASLEANFGSYFAGAIAGFRPDFRTFGIRTDLFQFGAYAGGNFHTRLTQHRATIGWLQQGNNGGIDRQYLYAQYSSSIGGKLQWFASTEIDLYENFDTAQAQQTFKVSSLYLSANYRFHPKWNLFASYDSRQQIIFFEQYDSEIERLLDESGVQQGYRVRLRYNPNRHWAFALGYHQRMRTQSLGMGQNAQVYMAYRDIPWVGGSLSLQGNLNLARYMQSEIGAVRYRRTIFNNKVDFHLYTRYLQYHYLINELAMSPEWYYGTEWSFRLGNDWSLGILAEYSMQRNQDVMRGNLRLIKRF